MIRVPASSVSGKDALHLQTATFWMRPPKVCERALWCLLL